MRSASSDEANQKLASLKAELASTKSALQAAQDKAARDKLKRRDAENAMDYGVSKCLRLQEELAAATSATKAAESKVKQLEEERACLS